MPPERSVNQGSMLDLCLREALIERGVVTLEKYDI
jgi:hypothetical protein